MTLKGKISVDMLFLVQDMTQTLLKANLTVVEQAECRAKYDKLEIRGLRGGLAESQM